MGAGRKTTGKTTGLVQEGPRMECGCSRGKGGRGAGGGEATQEAAKQRVAWGADLQPESQVPHPAEGLWQGSWRWTQGAQGVDRIPWKLPEKGGPTVSISTAPGAQQEVSWRYLAVSVRGEVCSRSGTPQAAQPPIWWKSATNSCRRCLPVILLRELLRDMHTKEPGDRRRGDSHARRVPGSGVGNPARGE